MRAASNDELDYYSEHRHSVVDGPRACVRPLKARVQVYIESTRHGDHRNNCPSQQMSQLNTLDMVRECDMTNIRKKRKG